MAQTPQAPVVDAPLERFNLARHGGAAILEGGDCVLVAFGRHARYVGAGGLESLWRLRHNTEKARLIAAIMRALKFTARTQDKAFNEGDTFFALAFKSDAELKRIARLTYNS